MFTLLKRNHNEDNVILFLFSGILHLMFVKQYVAITINVFLAQTGRRLLLLHWKMLALLENVIIFLFVARGAMIANAGNILRSHPRVSQLIVMVLFFPFAQ